VHAHILPSDGPLRRGATRFVIPAGQSPVNSAGAVMTSTMAPRR
jgi:hypothetical protein